MPKLLVIKPSSLGDIIHGLQALAVFKEKEPDLEVTWVVRTLFADLVEGSPLVDSIIPFRREDGWQGFREVCREVRNWRGDCVWDLQGLARTGIWTHLAKGERKLGRRDAREGARWFYPETVALPPGGKMAHALDVLLAFPEAMGVVSKEVPKLVLGDEALDEEFESFVSSYPHPIFVFPESRRAEKCWTGFDSLICRLLEEGRSVAVFGTGAPVLSRREGCYDGRGKHSLKALCGLMRRARAVVANDSGPMHLAAALGIPTLALFGPTDPVRYGPWPSSRATNRVVRGEGGDLSSVRVEEVMSVLEELTSLAIKGTG